MQKHNSGEQHEEHHGGHFVVPFKTLRNVAFALLGFTFLTVFTAQLHLGWAAAPIAFLIAFLKALLVMAFFMGLKFDVVYNRMIFGAAFFFLAVLYMFCALDIFTRILQSNTL